MPCGGHPSIRVSSSFHPSFPSVAFFHDACIHMPVAGSPNCCSHWSTKNRHCRCRCSCCHGDHDALVSGRDHRWMSCRSCCNRVVLFSCCRRDIRASGACLQGAYGVCVRRNACTALLHRGLLRGVQNPWPSGGGDGHLLVACCSRSAGTLQVPTSSMQGHVTLGHVALSSNHRRRHHRRVRCGGGFQSDDRSALVP